MITDPSIHAIGTSKAMFVCQPREVDATGAECLPGSKVIVGTCGHAIWAAPSLQAHAAEPDERYIAICNGCYVTAQQRRMAAGLPPAKTQMLREHIDEVQQHLGVAATDQILATARDLGITVADRIEGSQW